MNAEEKKQKIKALCNYADILSKKFTVVFITSHKEKTKNVSDYNAFSVKSEFYSNDLQNKIVNAFQSCGFLVREFFNEEDFIAYALKESSQELANIIVINSAQKGTHIGRKSLIPAFCDLYNIHYIGSNPYIVSLCRDKYRCGNILEQNKIKTPKAWIYSPRDGWLNGKPDSSIGRLIIKPNYESSSIGVNRDCIDYYNDSLERKIQEYSKTFNQDIIIEQFISGYEVETPVICTNSPFVLFPVGIKQDGKEIIGDYILDYVTRAENYYSLYSFEEYNKTLSEKLVKTAIKTVSLLNIQGFGRVDFRISTDGEFYVTDVSTNPHYTQNSSFFFVFSKLGFQYDDMIKCLIASAYERIILC